MIRIKSWVVGVLVVGSMSVAAWASPWGDRDNGYIPRRHRGMGDQPGAMASTNGRVYAMAMRVSQESQEAVEMAKRIFARDRDNQGLISQSETTSVGRLLHVGYEARKFAEFVVAMPQRYGMWDDQTKLQFRIALGWFAEATDLVSKDGNLFNESVMSPEFARQVRELRVAAERLVEFGRRASKVGFGMGEAIYLGDDLVREIGEAKAKIKAQINSRNFDATVELVRDINVLENEAKAFVAEAMTYANRGMFVTPRQVLADNYARLGRSMRVINTFTENYRRYGFSGSVDRAFDEVDESYAELRVVFGR